MSSTIPPERFQQEGLGYDPALFPGGWNSQDPSTWSTEEKLKSKIPGTREHQIKSDLNKLEPNEIGNQGQINQQNLNRDDMDQQNLNRNQIDQQIQDTDRMTTGEKIKAAIPGTKEHKAKKEEEDAEKRERIQNENLDREIRQDQGDGYKPNDQMTMGEKLKAVIPGTKEHRAKKAMEKEVQPVV